MVSEHDLKGLMKFAEREEWGECFAAVVDEHFGPILEAGGIEYEDLSGMVPSHWQETLWGCTFEDFLTLEFDVPGENIVDEYLKRRAWREKASAKAYMKALRTSIMSLYEVSNVVPGKSMKLRDLLRNTEPVTVSEFLATQSLKQWDRIAVRVIEVRGRKIISGGLLPFSFEGCDTLFDNLKEGLGLEKSQKLEHISDEALQHLAPLFTLSWLSNVLERVAFRQNPNLVNSDGEPVEFHDLRFAFASGVIQKQVSAELSKLPELEQENAKFWNWLDRKPSGRKLPNKDDTQDRMLETIMDDGSRVLGNIELKGKTLRLSVNSAGRAETGQKLIQQALGDLVRNPLTEIRTVKQLLEDASDRPERKPEDEIPPEIAKQIMWQHLDKHYRETLDEPIPALNNKTPRQAAKTKNGRKQVIEWLKYLENRSVNQVGSNEPMATYDFTWMWEELGIERPA